MTELHRWRDEIDREIIAVESGQVDVLDFRALDRSAREQIASWTGGKGELLAELIGDRTVIASSDQGRSFQAFYDFLLSEDRQTEFSELLAHVQNVDAIEADGRLRAIHHDWSDAAERTQQTVRLISEQLRRFLDDRVWLENRRVLDLVRGIEIVLPFKRPLHDARQAASVNSLLTPATAEPIDVSELLDQRFVNQTLLAENIRSVVPARGAALLTDIVELFPVEQGIAEIVGYLALDEDDLEVTLDESEEITIDYSTDDLARRARLPKVTVTRR